MKSNLGGDNDWVFWSGFEDQEWIVKFCDKNPYTKVGKTKYIGDVLSPDMVTKYQKPFQQAGKGWKFWSYMSQAFSREVSGNIFVVIPEGRPLNKPYADGKGSNFWSMELPELSRSDGVSKITRIYRGSDGKLTGTDYTIWNKPWTGTTPPYGEIGNPEVPVTQPTGNDVFGAGD